MANWGPRRASFMACRILPALLALGLCGSPAGAQTVDVTSAAQALARVAQLRSDIAAMRAVAMTPLGPYTLSNSCSWCSSEFLGICFAHSGESWSTQVDFTATRNRLNQVLAEAQQSADNFPRAFAPLQNWIDGVPAFTARFDREADVVLNIQQQTNAGRPVNDQQRQAVAQALQNLIGDLSASSAQLNTATKALAAALQQQSGYGAAIKQAIDGLDQSAKTALANAQKVAGTHRCQDGVPQRVNAIRANFSASITKISAAFQKLEASRQASDRGLAFLLGWVVSSRTDLQSVTDQIMTANKDQLGSFLQRLHLASAKTQWQQIATYANSMLSRGTE
jgi:hypothetical protein